MTGGYDHGYSRCRCFWGREPGSFVRRLALELRNLSGIRVLDAGCGEGKNAAYLAALGAKVVAIDVSDLALMNATEAWPTATAITWIQGDIRTIQLADGEFDIVIAYGLLHCLANARQVEQTVAKLKRSTVPGGYNIICSFNDRRQELKDAHEGFAPLLMAHEFLVGQYRDWSILECSDSDLVEKHPDTGIEHAHSMTRILARNSASICAHQ